MVISTEAESIERLNLLASAAGTKNLTFLIDPKTYQTRNDQTLAKQTLSCLTFLLGLHLFTKSWKSELLLKALFIVLQLFTADRGN